MTRWIALLRGINVSGKNAIRMAALQSSFERLGYKNVRTYLQSGNVVFDAKTSDTEKFSAKITAAIAQDFGLDVAVGVVSAQTLSRIVESNPFPLISTSDVTLYHATFLQQAVSAKQFAAVKLPAATGEQAKLLGNVVYLHCPHGYGNTKLNNHYFEKALGVTATTRNWRTVLALQQLCDAP